MHAWIQIEHQDNPDISAEYIGPLIHKKGFKVRYNNVEEYTDELRKKIENLFYKHGYVIRVKYNSNFSYAEIIAEKKEPRYVEIALVIAILWVVWRIYT